MLPIPLPYLRLAGIAVVLLAAGSAGWYLGSRAGAVATAQAEERVAKSDAKVAQYEADLANARTASVEQARETERQWQAAFDANARRLTDEKTAIASSLELALNGLRSRAVRTLDASGNPRPPCEGANGAELSAQDAEFLVREAARADTVRAGLIECYANIDAIQGVK